MTSRIRTRSYYATLVKEISKVVRSRRVARRHRSFSRRLQNSLKLETPRDIKPFSKSGMRSPAESSNILSPEYHSAMQDSRMTFAFFVESKFIPEHVARKTPTGQRHYQAILKHLLKPETVNRVFNPQRITNPRLKFVPGWPYLDEVRLCDITSDHVHRLVSSATDHGYSPQTIKHIKNVLLATISHAQREGCFIGANPVSQVKLPPVSRRKQHKLTVSQAREIIKYMQYPDQEIALFCLMTEMTIAEICNLQWKHVNLGNSEMYSDGEFIPPRSIAVRTSWNRDELNYYKHSRNRNIDIPEPLLSHLAELRSHAQKRGSHEFVLITEAGEPIRPESIGTARLRPIRRALGMPWLSWQILRRVRVSLLAELQMQVDERMIEKFSNLPFRPGNDYALAEWHEHVCKPESSAHSNNSLWSAGGSA